jgi:hypothetical protein
VRSKFQTCSSSPAQSGQGPFSPCQLARRLSVVSIASSIYGLRRPVKRQIKIYADLVPSCRMDAGQGSPPRSSSSRTTTSADAGAGRCRIAQGHESGLRNRYTKGSSLRCGLPTAEASSGLPPRRRARTAWAPNRRVRERGSSPRSSSPHNTSWRNARVPWLTPNPERSGWPPSDSPTLRSMKEYNVVTRKSTLSTPNPVSAAQSHAIEGAGLQKT